MTLRIKKYTKLHLLYASYLLGCITKTLFLTAQFVPMILSCAVPVETIWHTSFLKKIYPVYLLALKILKMILKMKEKSKCEKSIKWGPIISKMMRGFQIQIG